MDIASLIAELRSEKERVDEAIAALERLANGQKRQGQPGALGHSDENSPEIKPQPKEIKPKRARGILKQNPEAWEIGEDDFAYVFVRPRRGIEPVRVTKDLSTEELRSYVEGEVDIMRGLPNFQFAYNTREHAPKLKWRWRHPVLLGIVDESKHFRGFTREELKRILPQLPKRLIPEFVKAAIPKG